MTSCTNTALGNALGLSHSTVSRMRAGTRTGSVKTLIKLAEVSGVPLDQVAAASEAVREGKTDEWNAILEKACGADAGPE
jgi:transcriptional regulator with XRE-family HTH domain